MFGITKEINTKLFFGEVDRKAERFSNYSLRLKFGCLPRVVFYRVSGVSERGDELNIMGIELQATDAGQSAHGCVHYDGASS